MNGLYFGSGFSSLHALYADRCFRYTKIHKMLIHILYLYFTELPCIYKLLNQNKLDLNSIIFCSKSTILYTILL